MKTKRKTKTERFDFNNVVAIVIAIYKQTLKKIDQKSNSNPNNTPSINR